MSTTRFVSGLPDLIVPEEYASDPQGRRVRLRIQATADGVAVLGDAVRPEALERLLRELENSESLVIEQMLCG